MRVFKYFILFNVILTMSLLTGCGGATTITKPIIDGDTISYDGTYLLTFGAPDDVPNDREYELYEKNSEASEWPVLPDIVRSLDKGSTPPFARNFNKLVDEVYEYRLRACDANATNCSEYSDVHSVVVNISNPQVIVPTQPILSNNTTYISFGAPFDAPSNHNYELYETPKGSSSWSARPLLVRSVTGDTPPFDYQFGQTPNGEYDYRIRICVAETPVCSAYSNVLSIEVNADTVPDNPGTVTYYHTNHLGSPIAATNESAEVVWTKVYSPFGEEFTHGDIDDKQEIGYTGHQYDSDTQTNYMEERHYDPEIARFFSVDVATFDIASPQSFNPYIYANNSPFRFTDPNGETGVLSAVCGPGVLFCLTASVALTMAVDWAYNNWQSVPHTQMESYTYQQSMAIDATIPSKRLYVTYTFDVIIDGAITKYSGRTSGFPSWGDLPLYDAAFVFAEKRLNRHLYIGNYTIVPESMRLDKFSFVYAPIRGREETLIRYSGGARLLGGSAGNAISGVGVNNKNREKYRSANAALWGEFDDNSPYATTIPWNYGDVTEIWVY